VSLFSFDVIAFQYLHKRGRILSPLLVLLNRESQDINKVFRISEEQNYTLNSDGGYTWQSEIHNRNKFSKMKLSESNGQRLIGVSAHHTAEPWDKSGIHQAKANLDLHREHR
jgi:hypothetical protein